MKVQFLTKSMLFIKAGAGIAFIFGMESETAAEKKCCCNKQSG
jgi:hypothetical protein